MSHYLITGGAGFIGSHLVELLLAQGNQITVLDDLSTGKRENLPLSDVELVVGDIRDTALVQRVMAGKQGCFHLAAIASVTRSLQEWLLTHQVNQSGSVTVFEAAAKAGVPVVYASSAAVYGDNPNLPLTETLHTQPLSPYGLDKLACEWQAAIGARCLGLQSAGMRFFNVYGPRQDPASPYSGVISIFNARLHKGQDIAIFGDGEQSRDFIYVGDVVRYLVAALELLQGGYGEATVFNVCTETVTSIKDLASVMIHISEKESQIVYKAARAGDILHSCGSAAKAESLLKITAATPLLEGLTYLWHSIS